MSNSAFSYNPTNRWHITKKNIITGLLLVCFLAIAFWCHGRPDNELGFLGFMPLVVLALLSLIGVDIVLAVISLIIIAMIMTSTTLPEMGTMLAKSTGSFIATVGLIIMLGAGVGEVIWSNGAGPIYAAKIHALQRLGDSARQYDSLRRSFSAVGVSA